MQQVQVFQPERLARLHELQSLKPARFGAL